MSREFWRACREMTSHADWWTMLGSPMTYDGGFFVERDDNKAPSQHAVLSFTKQFGVRHVKGQSVYTQAVPPKEPTPSLDLMRETKERLQKAAAEREWVLIAPNGQVYAEADVNKLIGVLAKVHLDPNGL